jgi:hypothetical protein
MKKRRARGAGVTFDTVRKVALAFPETQEGTSYGTPAFRVRGKGFARLREDGESLVVRVDFDERELLMQANPRAFYITDHYRNYPYMLIRLSAVRADELQALLADSWRYAAPKRLVAARDAGGDAAEVAAPSRRARRARRAANKPRR